MAAFEVEYVDGSMEVVEADSAELVADEWHFVRTVGRGGEERWTTISLDRIAAIRTH